ncbi:MAG: ATP-binding protein [Legionellaceae bacterium]|nr:ATP-binding protein [Legionellaceae bacterium]
MDNLLKSLINHIPHAVFWKDTNHIFQGCNKEFAEQFGYESPDNIIGKSDYDFSFSPDAIQKYHLDEEEILTTGIAKLNYEEIQHQSDGTIKILFVSKVPVYDDKDQISGILGIYTDITERKNKEIQLKIAKAAAEAANHAKIQFIANMSHDIRTPLTGIIGLSTILAQAEENPLLKQYSHDIHDCGKQLLNMLNSILDMASADQMNERDIVNESFELKKCIQDIVDIEKPTATFKKLNLLTYIDPALPMYLINDQTKIHRILLNLLSNAVKFTFDGSITISVQLIKLSIDKAIIRFSIIDTGIGIPVELQHQIFDRFFRASPSYKGQYAGHGVGLQIAQSYANLLKSEIKLTSQEGKGTIFYFDLTSMVVF